jgi:hypothetical protein
MANSTVSSNVVSIGSRDALNEILRQGAQQMLAQAIENEVAEYLGRHADQRDEPGQIAEKRERPVRETLEVLCFESPAIRSLSIVRCFARRPVEENMLTRA